LPTLASLLKLQPDSLVFTSASSENASLSPSLLLDVILWLATSDVDRGHEQDSPLLYNIHSKTKAVMVALPRSLEAIIALELVAAFLPLDLHMQQRSVEDDQCRTAPGENQLRAAISIAESMHLKDDYDTFVSMS
jgi:hypothetical protein